MELPNFDVYFILSKLLPSRRLLLAIESLRQRKEVKYTARRESKSCALSSR